MTIKEAYKKPPFRIGSLIKRVGADEPHIIVVGDDEYCQIVHTTKGLVEGRATKLNNRYYISEEEIAAVLGPENLDKWEIVNEKV